MSTQISSIATRRQAVAGSSERHHHNNTRRPETMRNNKIIILTAAIASILATAAVANAQEFTKVSVGNPTAKNPLSTILPKKDQSERPKRTALWVCQTPLGACYVFPPAFLGAACLCPSPLGPVGGVIIGWV